MARHGPPLRPFPRDGDQGCEDSGAVPGLAVENSVLAELPGFRTQHLESAAPHFIGDAPQRKDGNSYPEFYQRLDRIRFVVFHNDIRLEPNLRAERPDGSVDQNLTAVKNEGHRLQLR